MSAATNNVRFCRRTEYILDASGAMEPKTIRLTETDSRGFLRMEGVLAANQGDLSDRFCSRPFELMEIHDEGKSFLRCPAWLPTSVGTISDVSLLETFNSETAQAVRASILDGFLSFLSSVICPLIQIGGKTRTREPRIRRWIYRLPQSL